MNIYLMPISTIFTAKRLGTMFTTKRYRMYRLSMHFFTYLRPKTFIAIVTLICVRMNHSFMCFSTFFCSKSLWAIIAFVVWFRIWFWIRVWIWIWLNTMHCCLMLVARTFSLERFQTVIALNSIKVCLKFPGLWKYITQVIEHWSICLWFVLSYF